MSNDISAQLAEQVRLAHADQSPLRIVAGNSKAFYGNPVTGETLDVAGHAGVISYEPTELVITARAGTPLREIEQLLADNGQMLAFEPPSFADTATIGGTIACNLSGPARAYAGAARDFLLGCRIINGKGEILHFGGEVMKNVAGYDASRLMSGAMGTLGVLLDVSMKVLPIAETSTTLQLSLDAQQALDKIHTLSQTPLPISASSHHHAQLYIRLSGAGDAVRTAAQAIGGEAVSNGENYWQQLKEQQTGFFSEDKACWRISVASDTPPALTGEHDVLYEWGGALRWLCGELDVAAMRKQTSELGGHVSLFRNARTEPTSSVFQPLPPSLLRIHNNLKQAFDPGNILNPGKLYPDMAGNGI